jgi:hypothetical protein
MSHQRQVIIDAFCQPPGDTLFEVSFTISADFLDRLRQLRSLVPPVTSLTSHRDLIIDKVRARLPNAAWRSTRGDRYSVSGSSLVVASDGTMSCAAKLSVARIRVGTHALSIDGLIHLHKITPPEASLIFRAAKSSPATAVLRP